MIVLKPKAGLCNRMRAVSSACQLAEKYKTKLVIFWNRDSGLNCRFDKLFLDIPGVKVINYHLRYDFLFALVSLFFRNKFLNVRIKERKKYESCLADGKSIIVSTYSNLSRENGFKCLKIVPEIQTKIDNILDNIDRDNLVGVHIRRTDHKIAIEKSPTELFINEMKKELESNNDVKFFLATDSKEERKIIEKIFNDNIIWNTNIVYGRDSESGIINALIDLGCLSECSKIIGSSGSSFSWTAAKWNKERPLKYIGE